MSSEYLFLNIKSNPKLKWKYDWNNSLFPDESKNMVYWLGFVKNKGFKMDFFVIICVCVLKSRVRRFQTSQQCRFSQFSVLFKYVRHVIFIRRRCLGWVGHISDQNFAAVNTVWNYRAKHEDSEFVCKFFKSCSWNIPDASTTSFYV